MTTSTLAGSMVAWSSPQQPIRARNSSTRETQELTEFKTGRWRGLGMLGFILAIGAATAYAAFASPHTELAQRTLEAERIQNLSYVWLANQSPERHWQPIMELMLPVTSRSVASVAKPGA